MAKAEFTVRFDLPRGATITDAREYVTRAVVAECGARNPKTDPMAHLDRKSVRVTRKAKKPAAPKVKA